MLPSPEPILVVHVRGVQAHDPPRRFVHACHHLSIVLKGSGPYFNGPCELPPRPCLSLLAATHDDVNGFVGPVEAWFVGFNWPGVTIEARGKVELQFSAGPAGAAPGKGGSPEAVTAANAGSTGTARSEFLAPRVKPVDATAAAQFVEQFVALQGATSRQDPVGRLSASGRLMQLLAAYFEMPSGSAAVHGHRGLARFHELLVERACDPVTMEDLAAEAGVTADHLRDLFRARYGLRPIDFRTGVRLSKARDLLASSALNVSEVARQVGYPDPLYFSRAFRKHFGFTPSDLIKRYRLPG